MRKLKGGLEFARLTDVLYGGPKLNGKHCKGRHKDSLNENHVRDKQGDPTNGPSAMAKIL